MKKIKLSIKNLEQSYGGIPVLKGISLDIYEGETLVVLGPSGCGKTSLLKSVAGLIPVEGGELVLDGRNVALLPPQERKTAMIFQNYALFPHMTVGENLEYGLKVKGRKEGRNREKIRDTLALFKLEGLEDRPVTELSGGQQQRVAIGRAMIIGPSVLLFDEPLSNLDENLRKQMRNEIRSLLRQANVTSLYVTHDQNEALAMADRIVIMREGGIEQISAPAELHYRPASEYVARFLGYGNLFSGERRNGRFFLFGKEISSAPESGKFHTVLIRPEDIGIAADGDSDETLAGTVADIEIQSSIIRYRVKTDFGDFDVSMLNSRGGAFYSPNDSLYLRLKEETFHYL
ncbi:MAG: ABC transporter ATP-binding protein [Spirochaetales bacterium]|nr:ABC transporter ATP-binding protein [Spirochaetales bacterium]